MMLRFRLEQLSVWVRLRLGFTVSQGDQLPPSN